MLQNPSGSRHYFSGQTLVFKTDIRPMFREWTKLKWPYEKFWVKWIIKRNDCQWINRAELMWELWCGSELTPISTIASALASSVCGRWRFISSPSKSALNGLQQHSLNRNVLCGRTLAWKTNQSTKHLKKTHNKYAVWKFFSFFTVHSNKKSQFQHMVHKGP